MSLLHLKLAPRSGLVQDKCASSSVFNVSGTLAYLFDCELIPTETNLLIRRENYSLFKVF